jgi:N-formylglutamate deformylase
MDLPIAPACAPDATSPPIMLSRPERQTVPLVFASAHSGRNYSAEFVAAARLDALALRRSEDGFVDELFAAAPSLGAPLLAATFPRAFCDANREPWELDPDMFEERLPAWVNTTSPRVGAGLGMIARVVASGEAIYRRKLRFVEAERRVQLYWEPFHAALRDLVDATRRQFGVCLLVDCHSMPGNCAAPNPPADFVLGDAHGTACAAEVTRRAEQALADQGYRVRRNDPYAGGYITRHYGRPHEGMHALQIEVCRPLYMDEAGMTKLPAFDDMQRAITVLVGTLADLGPALAAG